MSSKTMNENPTSREARERSSLRARLNPLLTVLGFVPVGDPLPELSRWRRQVQGRTA